MTVKPSKRQTEGKSCGEGRAPFLVCPPPRFHARCQLHTCDKYNPTAVTRGWEPGEQWAGGDNSSPRPLRGLFSAGVGVSAHGSSESRWWSWGESLGWQRLSQGWGRGYYTAFTFGLLRKEQNPHDGTHRLLGKVGALTLCSPYLPSQSLQESNARGRLQIKKKKEYMKLQSDFCGADYPSSSDRTSLLWRTSFGRLQAMWSEEKKIRKTTPHTAAQREEADL